MYSTRIAYLLWFATFFGFSGLHRLYLGKTGSGILYLLTWGLFGLGTIYDAVTLPEQVREAKIKARMRRVIDDRLLAIEDDELGRRGRSHERESLEHVILRVAKQHHGIAAPAEVALEAKIPVDDARKQLDKLVEKGVAEVRVRKNGTIVYALPDFLDDTANSQLESF
ncbi:MAG: NINE protein [Spirochaetales bacterium]